LYPPLDIVIVGCLVGVGVVEIVCVFGFVLRVIVGSFLGVGSFIVALAGADSIEFPDAVFCMF